MVNGSYAARSRRNFSMLSNRPVLKASRRGTRLRCWWPKHGHHSMFGPAVDLCRESRPAGPWDTHEPMVQVRRCYGRVQPHWPPFNQTTFNRAPLPIGDEEDAGNSRRLRRPLPNSRMDNPVPLLQLAATFAFPGWAQRVGPFQAAFADVNHHRPNQHVERFLLREPLMYNSWHSIILHRHF